MGKPRKNSIPRIVLEYIQDMGSSISDVLSSKYPFATAAGFYFEFKKNQRASVSRSALSVALTRLKKQKLIVKTSEGWKITPKGKHILELDELDRDVQKEDGICRLVIFDIPEKERKKRNRIRTELLAQGFTILQKSVWFGYRPLSAEFIKLIHLLNIQNKVHIFSVQHYGTLQAIDEE